MYIYVIVFVSFEGQKKDLDLIYVYICYLSSSLSKVKKKDLDLIYVYICYLSSSLSKVKKEYYT